MQVLLDANLAYLAMPKTGSTSIQTALRPHAQISYHRNPQQKHMHAEYFEHFIRPYLVAIGKADVETVCQIREPISWLSSWWRYRSDDALADTPQSTARLTFEDFAAEYLDSADRPYLDISRPLGLIADQNGKILVQKIFRYEAMGQFVDYLSSRLDQRIDLSHKNVSPKRNATLSRNMRSRLEAYFAPEMDIWENGTVADTRSVVRRLGDKAIKMVPNPLR